MTIYKFKFLGSITECKYVNTDLDRQLIEVSEPEPILLEICVSAVSSEQAQRKMRRVIAWDVEHKLNNTSA